MDYLTHLTVEGDRWDLLANRYYANPYRYQPIVEANLVEVGFPAILEGGIALKIPILPVEETTPSDLPPWKR